MMLLRVWPNNQIQNMGAQAGFCAEDSLPAYNLERSIDHGTIYRYYRIYPVGVTN